MLSRKKAVYWKNKVFYTLFAHFKICGLSEKKSMSMGTGISSSQCRKNNSCGSEDNQPTEVA
jgi:hypothetical protein